MANTLTSNNTNPAEAASKTEAPRSEVRHGDGSRTELLINLQASLDPSQVLERFYVHLAVHFGIQGVRADLPGHYGALPLLGSNARYHFQLRLRQDGGETATVTLMRASAFTAAERTALEEYAGLLHFPLRNAILYQEALHKARQDDLTGLFNRVALRETVERELSLGRRHGQPLSLVMLDLDDFKEINDEHGHRTGDRVLREFADVIRDCARCSDLLFRYAGDEFIIVSSHTDLDGATAFAERIRERVVALDIQGGAGRVDLRVSVGVAEAAGDDSYERFFERVDQALYRAKHAGRDRVVASS